MKKKEKKKKKEGIFVNTNYVSDVKWNEYVL